MISQDEENLKPNSHTHNLTGAKMGQKKGKIKSQLDVIHKIN